MYIKDEKIIEIARPGDTSIRPIKALNPKVLGDPWPDLQTIGQF